MTLCTWWRERKINNLEERIAGLTAELDTYRRGGYENGSVARQLAVAQYRLAKLKPEWPRRSS
jgi:hypothetical protein